MMNLFDSMSRRCGRIVTECYSTSFASSVRLLHRDLREAVYTIYGLVRVADEIVDTFHEHDKKEMLCAFRRDTYAAISDGISLNPVLHGFQLTVRHYRIGVDLIEAFFDSMEMDLYEKNYDSAAYFKYISGSAEAVGLMCLRVFCEGDEGVYTQLEPYARSLGAAFQKVNFLRDLGADYRRLERSYFPGTGGGRLSEIDKRAIEADILADFRHAEEGIVRLPHKARLGVYVAYKYYVSLFKKIQTIEPAKIPEVRVRIPNYRKWLILVAAGFRYRNKLL